MISKQYFQTSPDFLNKSLMLLRSWQQNGFIFIDPLENMFRVVQFYGVARAQIEVGEHKLPKNCFHGKIDYKNHEGLPCY